MQEIITEILERLGFPTKKVDRLAFFLENWELKDLLSLTVITNDTEILGYLLNHKHYHIGGKTPNFCQKVPDLSKEWRYCSLGSELVARLKGGEV